jgi:HAE1 family hydrophobic/amphiphilic exporter-1
VPVVYCYMDDLAAWCKRRFSPASKPEPKASPPKIAGLS